MRSLISAIIVLLTFTVSAAQKTNRKFIYGRLFGSATYTGYFWFDNELSQMGQRILYKENLEVKKAKTLYAMNFETFTSDSLFLRTFKTIPYGTGRLQAMIPRLVSGELELYNAIYAGFYAVSKSDHFYIYDGRQSVRLVRRKFKEQMQELLRDDAEILQRIDREELTYDDLPTIIYNYNRRKQGINLQQP